MKGETVELLDRNRNFRLSADEDEELARRARGAGMTVSQLVRKTLRDALFLASDVTIPPTVSEIRTNSTTSPSGELPNSAVAS